MKYLNITYKNKAINLFPKSLQGFQIVILINIVLFIVLKFFNIKSFLFFYFGLTPKYAWVKFYLWQFITYFFLHDNFLHIFFNMFMLWLIGKEIEQKFGRNKFLFYYLFCGICGGMLSALLQISSTTPIVGASGAIWGLLAAFWIMFPNRLLLLYGIFPVKVKYLLFFLCIIDIIGVFNSFYQQYSNISHLTHLSGLCIGLILMYFKVSFISFSLPYDKNIKLDIDKILDKINYNGWNSLTQKEKDYLNKYSKEYNKNVRN